MAGYVNGVFLSLPHAEAVLRLLYSLEDNSELFCIISRGDHMDMGTGSRERFMRGYLPFFT